MKKLKIEKLAVSGDPGSFSEEAGLLFLQRNSIEAEIVHATDMESVLKLVNDGTVDHGIFPVVNSRGGLVHAAFDAMGQYTFRVIDEVWFEVYQCLMLKPGVEMDQVTQISSHPQAIAQCERYLRTHFPKTPIVEWEDTAKAAHDLAHGGLPETAAVIAPARSAHLYDLNLIEKGIHDNHPNLTTFVVVEKL